MSKEYNQYLKEHKENVAKAFYWMRENLPNVFVNVDEDLERQICVEHDSSKSIPDEYYPYDNYFYMGNQSYEIINEFNIGWLNHIHRNPHHWQHWVLLNDDPSEGEKILDMPDNYIIEMICDWWSFSFKQNKLDEIFNWYNQHKSYIKLSEKTRNTVEYILGEIEIQLKLSK